MQTKAAAEQVAGGGGLVHGQLQQYRQDSSSGEKEEEEDVHRSEREGSSRDALSQVSQAFRAGDHVAGGLASVGEGGGARVVLQPEAEGEAHDTARRAAAPRGTLFSQRERGRRLLVP